MPERIEKANMRNVISLSGDSIASVVAAQSPSNRLVDLMGVSFLLAARAVFLLAHFHQKAASRALLRMSGKTKVPGNNGMPIGQFPAFFRYHWEKLHSALMEGTCRPAAVRRV
jgi:hypothetical protein